MNTPYFLFNFIFYILYFTIYNLKVLVFIIINLKTKNVDN